LILFAFSKKPDSALHEVIAVYEKRLTHYVNFQTKLLSPSAKSNTSAIRQEESVRLFKEIKQEDYLILLDDKGIMQSSEEFAELIQKRLNDSSRRTIFCIGGAYGFHESIYRRADYKLSLSKLTLPHQLCRLMFTEQLYRACTILKGEKYHHG
jgi:23S rRNA (pseudouridine1915-N3)-methyltransferase